MTTTGSGPTKGKVASLATFGDRLAAIRQEMRIHPHEAAALIGVSDQTWRNWEAGTTQPQKMLETARKIAEATDYDLTWLLLGPLGDNPLTRCSTDKRGAHVPALAPAA